MARLNRVQCENVVYRYFLREGWLPPGTTTRTWREVKVSDLGMDDPPLPSDRNLQKRRVSLDLQDLFEMLGGSIGSPLSQLKKKNLKLVEFARWCFENQRG